MIVRMQNALKKRSRLVTFPSDQIAELYGKLSFLSQTIEERIEQSKKIRERASFVVLHEDILSLLSECEELLVVNGPVFAHELSSLLSRSSTVIMEVSQLIGKSPKSAQIIAFKK